MADERIIDFPDGTVDTDDYLGIDGSTNGTRKVPVGRAGGPPVLDSSGKVADRLAYEGVAGGVALLDSNGMPLTAASEAVVESGSNADGEWVKLADGTMICHNNQAKTGLSPLAYTVQGLDIYRVNWTWTFPVAFVDVPAVLGSPRLYNGGAALIGTLGTMYPAGTTASDTKVVIESLLSYDEVREPALVAVGRWK